MKEGVFMGIKYHQNGTGQEYGADHKLTNNWNPDLNYGNEYAKVYFRMETKGYSYPSFSFTAENKEAFESEIVKVFTSLGWTCKENAFNGVCSTWCKGNSHLYLHPQNFSGEVLKNEIKSVAEALKSNNTFYLRWVDLYDTVYDITDNEYEEILSSKDNEMKQTILERSKTKRTNQFYNVDNVVRVVSDDFRLARIGNDDGEHYGFGQTGKHILKLIHSLIEDGYLVSCLDEHETLLIRTINKTEQKKKKLFVA